jgi:TPR repeat protein
MMGAGVEKDPEAAVKWFRKAAEQGNAEAQFNLGYCYCKGQGVAKDAIDGMYWLRRAAEQNNSQAQLNLGVCYAMGDGTPKDLVEACKWMLLASWQGEEKAKVGVNKMTEVLSKEDFARAQTLAKEFKPRPFQPAKKDQ